jgi:hypothetical protein
VYIKLISLTVLLSQLVLCDNYQYSKLWGKEGELWSPSNQLPDFSFAGYLCGNKEIPHIKATSTVSDFGAIPNSDQDMTQAFKDAIAASSGGAISIPAGRYLLSDILWIKKSNLVLRGEGPGKTILEFTKDLEDIRPNMGKTTSGKSTSNYSWSGGFIWLKGSYGEKFISKINQESLRGTYKISLDDSEKLVMGQYITIELTEDNEKQLIHELYSNDCGDITNFKRTTKAKFTSKILQLNQQTIVLERPLPFDIKLKWKPIVKTFNPTLTHSGIENMTIAFPNSPYEGHFSERGKNAVAFNAVAHSWVTDVRFQNCDSGIFMNG